MDTLCPLPLLPPLPLSVGKAPGPAPSRLEELPEGPSCPRSWWWPVDLSPLRHGLIPDLHLNWGFVPCPWQSEQEGNKIGKSFGSGLRSLGWVLGRGIGWGALERRAFPSLLMCFLMLLYLSALLCGWLRSWDARGAASL